MTQAGKQLARARLDCLCRIVTDGTHDSPKLQQSGIPFVKGKHISGGFVDLENCDHITKEDHEKAIQRSKPERGDILFSNIGSVGDAAFISIDKAFSIKNVALFKPDPDVVDSKYLYYVVLGPKFRGELFAKRSGVAQPFFSLEMLRSHEVEYHHDLTIQKKIASILSTYDDLIENNLRRIKILEKMAQALYREWFVKFRFPGHEKTRMVDSPMGKIPEGWEIVPFKTLVNCVRDSTNAGDHLSDRLYVPIDCIPRHSLTLLEAKHWKEAKSSLMLFEEGDILFGAMRPYFHKVVVAPFKGVTRTTCFVLRPKTQLFLAYATMTAFQDETIGSASAHSRGATIPYAVWDGSLAEMDVLLPSELVITRFNDILSPILRLFQAAYYKVFNLRRTRDLLLPKLISGELDVSDLDIDVAEEAA